MEGDKLSYISDGFVGGAGKVASHTEQHLSTILTCYYQLRQEGTL